jgi:hypothetical protein
VAARIVSEQALERRAAAGHAPEPVWAFRQLAML